MSLDDLGEAALGGGADGSVESIPIPPYRPGGPPLPPPPGGDDGGAAPPEDDAERRATVPVVLALVLTALVGVGVFAVFSWAGSGSSCDDGDFRSARFGYCVRTPSGWIAEGAEDGSHDRFLLPDGPATITVTAVTLTKGQDLARFEQFVRGYVDEAGARAGSSTTLEVGDADAVAFDASLSGPEGVTRSREVLFAQDGIAWRVTLADDEVGFGSSVRRLEELLDSWRFT
jgi:hypothetical protein